MDKDNEKNHEVIVLNTVFYNKPFSLYIFKRLSKVSNAIYLVTDIIKDEEPLKWALRNSAINTMSFMNTIKDISLSSREIISNLTHIKYLLDLGRVSKIVSEMNHGIMKREVEAIILEVHNETSGHRAFSDDFFQVARMPEIRKSEQNERHNYKGHNAVLYNRQVSFNKKDIRHGQDISNNTKNEDRAKRRDEILNIIKTKPNLTIKDISSVVKGCSEKTIQRELINLLKDNVIKKTGERRWSRYSPV